MKNLQPTCTMFSGRMSGAAAETKTSKNLNANRQTLRRAMLSMVLLGMLLIGTSSCSRNVSSGCGTWPVVKPNHGQYRSDTWPIKVKNSQFANYKRYN